MKQILRIRRPAAAFLRCIDRQQPSRLPVLQRVCGARTFHRSSTRQEEKKSDKENDSLSFRGQLYESTAERLKRERSSEAQYIQASRGRRGESKTIALSVGT